MDTFPSLTTSDLKEVLGTDISLMLFDYFYLFAYTDEGVRSNGNIRLNVKYVQTEECGIAIE